MTLEVSSDIRPRRSFWRLLGVRLAKELAFAAGVLAIWVPLIFILWLVLPANIVEFLKETVSIPTWVMILIVSIVLNR